jgi:hypothetical protein
VRQFIESEVDWVRDVVEVGDVQAVTQTQASMPKSKSLQRRKRFFMKVRVAKTWIFLTENVSQAGCISSPKYSNKSAITPSAARGLLPL